MIDSTLIVRKINLISPFSNSSGSASSSMTLPR
jgi:hypothetical protein